MFEFFVAEINTGFAIALIIVMMIGLLEGIGMIIGLSLMNLLDQISPFDIEVDINTDVTTGGMTSIFGWLCLNRLPLLIWTVLFLTSFAVAGYILNFILLNNFNFVLPTFITYSFAILMAILSTRFLGQPLANLLPQNESSAISNDSFKGVVAKITIGTAKEGSPAQAVLTDHYNQKHYVLVTPDNSIDTFNQNEDVVLVEKLDSHWLAVKFTP